MRSKKNHLAVGGPEHLALTLLPRSIGREVGSWRNWKTWTWCQFLAIMSEGEINSFSQLDQRVWTTLPICQWYQWMANQESLEIVRCPWYPMLGPWESVLYDFQLLDVTVESAKTTEETQSEPKEGVSLKTPDVPDTTASGNCFYYLCNWETNAHEQSGNRLLRTMKPILMKPVLNSVMKILEPFSAENLFKLKSILFQKSTKNLKTFSSTYSSSA